MPRKSSFPQPGTIQEEGLANQVPFDVPATPGPALTEAATAAKAAPDMAPTFRVGDYEVGDGYFSELSGHPDIRY